MSMYVRLAPKRNMLLWAFFFLHITKYIFKTDEMIVLECGNKLQSKKVHSMDTLCN